MAKLTVDRIQGMKSQGLSNNQIIKALQGEGYKSSEIFDALNQVSIQPTGPGATTPQPLNKPQPAVQDMAQPPLPAAFGASDEELIEAIIDEKWNDLLEDINRIIAWKDRTTQRIDQFDQGVSEAFRA